ncbi:MAG: PQQ-like beta-propeller repeat protein [Verrucomicrobia bacterium]|nr:PQQ-like beta-propeller repeat protein [Verrucomicrobiota bacterium]
MKLNRMSSFVFTAAFSFAALALVSGAFGSDWPQWRGPLRNGIVPDSPPLANEWPSKGLTKLWDSEAIPSDDDGGHGSVVAAGGRVYASIVWHTDVPTETRAIDDLVMRLKLGYQSVAGWPKETVESMEKERLALDPNIKGAALDKVIADWLEKHLDSKKRQTTSGFVRSRFEKRGDAIPLEVYDKLLTVSKTRFPNQAAMEKWVNEQDFSDKIKKQIIAAVPPTMKVADDVVICLDLATGKTLWKCKSPGEAVGRLASSTPCVSGGRVFALGSTHCYAVDANSGKLIWSAPMPGKAPASSPMVADGVLVMNAGKLAAFDAATGKQLWVQPKAGGGNSSPVAWKCGDKTVAICNGRGVMAGVDLKSGDVLWTTPAGGDCTPAIVGDSLAAQASNPKIGIFAGKLAATGFSKLWNYPIDPLRSQSSPLIVDNQIYLMDDNVHYCFDLPTGRELWQEKTPSSTISSPAFADGKVFLLANGGAKVLMFKPSPEKRIQLGKATTRGMWVPSPAIADGKLVVRGRQAITCYDLTAKPPAVAKASGQ